MGHNLQALGTASLDTMGGMVTLADARDIPEGASPRCQDVDFLVGSVFTRDGLQSIYAFATTLHISGYSMGSGGSATFTYSGPEPTVNEGFRLSGFTGILSVLNGQEIFVETVSMTQFTANVSNGPIITLTNLSGSAVSTTGLFVGPNLGSIATSTTWSNPNGIFSSTTYASASVGNADFISDIPPTISQANVGGFIYTWNNLSNLTSSSSFTTCDLTPGLSFTGYSEIISATCSGINVPATATVTGISVSYSGSVTSLLGSIVVQLTSGGILIGSAFEQALATTNTPYTFGSSAFQWGTTLTPTLVNGTALGLQLYAVLAHGAAVVSLNDLVVTVYYTLSTASDILLDQGFNFTVSLASGVSGFGASFSAYSSAASEVIMQLLLNGVPVGNPKPLTLNTTPTVYTLGGATDPWGAVWTPANVNSPQFGVQITAGGTGTTYVGDLDIVVYLTASQENFNWVGSYEQNNGALNTLALDAAGNLWIEDVINNPNVLSLALSGIVPGSYAQGSTFDNNEYIMFSNLSIGTDRPRQLDANGSFYPVTQVGPGAPPSLAALTGNISGILQLTAFTWSAGVATFTYNTAPAAPTVGSLYIIAGTGTALDGQIVEVLGPTPTVTSFTAVVTGTFPASSTITGTMTPQFAYEVSSIVQTSQYLHIESPTDYQLGNGATNSSAGSTITVFYANWNTAPEDTNLLTAFGSGNGAWVYISGTASSGLDIDGVWQVIAMGHAPLVSTEHWYFSFQYTSNGAQNVKSSGFNYRQTLATMTVTPPILGLSAGSNVTITGVTGSPQSGWNNTWTILEAVNTGQYNIESTLYSSSLTTYQYEFAGSNNQAPIMGQLIQIIGVTNNAGMNGTFVINTVNTAANTFTVAMTLPIPNQTTAVPEGNAQAIMSGTQFQIDPGETFAGTNVDVIYLSTTYGTNGGQIVVLGSSIVPIGAGTRQVVCFFITDSGSWTPASLPATFTVTTDANLLNVTSLPIGPSNVVGRGVAITEAGANGVPGANFYVITSPVTQTVNGTQTTSFSTIINDNISTTAQFSFTDAVLLDSTEIDISGLNLFNTIEIGSSAWCVPYASRMFYGMQLNKVYNFNNLTFDGGYVNLNQPLGWSLYLTVKTTPAELQLVNSPVTGSAAYIINNTGVVQPIMGLMAQTAYQDLYNVAILSPNTGYSVRVSASCPSGIQLGNLVIDVTALSNGNFGTTYGSFTVPLSSMGVLVSTFSGTLLAPTIFSGTVPSTVQLRVSVQNMGIGADCLIDRIEVYPTAYPYLKAQVYGSYINYPEEVDASTTEGGILDTSTLNPQTCVGAFTLRESMYLLKTNSLFVTKDNPNSEPGGWSISEVSNRAGAVGIHAYDTGDEWAVFGCRTGLYGFNGGVPTRLSEEIFQVWDAINWEAGNTIVVRNDTNNRRILCAVPMATGTSPSGVAAPSVAWLPYAPYNPAPTSPNVILMLNYQALSTFEELVNSPEMHTTMFGTLAVQDMKRKWAIWNIATPYMGFILQSDYIDQPLYICNGIGSSKIYQLNPEQLSDDGVAIYSSYTTYGFVNAAKAVTMPIFGMHNKRYTVLQVNTNGAGIENFKIYPNTLNARYPYSVPVGITLSDPAQNDYFRSINVAGNRIFIEVSTNAVGSYFNLCKLLVTGKQDQWSPINPTGGGNAGIY